MSDNFYPVPMILTRLHRKLAPLLAVACFLLLPSAAGAMSENCPGGDWCACPGETQCLAPYATCEEACAGGVRSAPAYDPAAAQRAADNAAAIAEANRRQAIINTNNAGVDYYKRSDWANAIQFFQSALNMDPTNQLYKDNLANATEALQNEKNAAAYQAEQARQNADA